MTKKRTVRIQNLTAKIASLVLAVTVWFLVGILLEDQRQSGKAPVEQTILGPAVIPDLQGPEDDGGSEDQKPTVH